jgi:hypothetical protein
MTVNPEKRIRRLTVIRDENRRGGKPYPRWIARWRVGGKAVTRYLGPCDKMTEAEALEKAIQLKAQDIEREGLKSSGMFDGLVQCLSGGDPRKLASWERIKQEDITKMKAAIKRGIESRRKGQFVAEKKIRKKDVYLGKRSKKYRADRKAKCEEEIRKRKSQI